MCARTADSDLAKNEKRGMGGGGLRKNEKDEWMLEEGVETVEKRHREISRRVGNEQEKVERKRRGERVHDSGGGGG